MKPVPYVARWRLEPPIGGGFDGTLVLDDPALFAGHYPGAPILPGTFLVEALFQAARTALAGDVRIEQIALCRFRSPLFPGDELRAHFSVKPAGAGWTIEVAAQGRAPAAELSLLVAPVHDEPPDGPAPAAQATSGRALDAAFIERVLPHRPPALLVEHALVLDASATRPELRAFKTVTAAEPCFAGAGSPLAASYPRSLVVESFCQSCGLLRAAITGPAGHRDRTRVPVVAKLANLRFFGDAKAGDRLEHQVSLDARTPDGAVFSGQTAVSGRVIMQVDRVVAATTPIAPVER
jgi:3-hydroxyacyl-[acyl-carrier-protein] dehydratase